MKRTTISKYIFPSFYMLCGILFLIQCYFMLKYFPDPDITFFSLAQAFTADLNNFNIIEAGWSVPTTRGYMYTVIMTLNIKLAKIFIPSLYLLSDINIIRAVLGVSIIFSTFFVFLASYIARKKFEFISLNWITVSFLVTIWSAYIGGWGFQPDYYALIFSYIILCCIFSESIWIRIIAYLLIIPLLLIKVITVLYALPPLLLALYYYGYRKNLRICLELIIGYLVALICGFILIFIIPNQYIIIKSSALMYGDGTPLQRIRQIITDELKIWNFNIWSGRANILSFLMLGIYSIIGGVLFYSKKIKHYFERTTGIIRNYINFTIIFLILFFIFTVFNLKLEIFYVLDILPFFLFIILTFSIGYFMLYSLTFEHKIPWHFALYIVLWVSAYSPIPIQSRYWPNHFYPIILFCICGFSAMYRNTDRLRQYIALSTLVLFGAIFTITYTEQMRSLRSIPQEKQVETVREFINSSTINKNKPANIYMLYTTPIEVLGLRKHKPVNLYAMEINSPIEKNVKPLFPSLTTNIDYYILPKPRENDGYFSRFNQKDVDNFKNSIANFDLYHKVYETELFELYER